MKSMQVSGAAITQLTGTGNVSAPARPPGAEESFGSSWRRETSTSDNVTGQTVVNASPYSIPESGTVAVSIVMPGATKSAVDDGKGYADENAAARAESAGHGRNAGVARDSHVIREALSGATVKPRRELGSAVLTGSVAPGAKRRAASTSGISSALHMNALTVQEAVSCVAGGSSTLPSAISLLGDTQQHAAPKTQGMAGHLTTAGTAPVLPRVPQAAAMTNDQPASAASSVEASQQQTEVRARAHTHESTAPRSPTSIHGSIHTESLISEVSGLRRESVTPGGVSISPPPAHSSTISARNGSKLNLAGPGPAMTGTAPQTITSTPTRLDVGVLNGTHGWLKIRAELGAGGAVHASVTAIDAAHESLRSALPEIASYLSVEAVKVKSIEVHRFADFPGTLIDAGAKGQTDDDHQGGGQGTTRQSGVPVPTVSDSTADDSPLDAGGVTISGLSSSAPVGGWVTNLSSATLGLTWRGGFAGSGVWLDVCA